jgi:hypothetical protein
MALMASRMPFEASLPACDVKVAPSNVKTVLSEELETTMRLMGVNDLSNLHPAMVNATRLEMELPPSLPDFAFRLRSNL